VQSKSFEVAASGVGGGVLQVDYAMDFGADERMGRLWAVALALLTLLAGGGVGAATWWQIRRQLRPLRDLAEQTRAISAGELHQRLSLSDPAEELLPWIEQFNAMMQRLELSYRQLEGFNADVAHELRTPIAALMGHTEVALSRERSADALRDTLTSNLEELQRLAALVNDMLFLSRADRGAEARRGERASLAELARQVVDFHEAPLADAGLTVEVIGDTAVAVDEPLFKRAVSNLLGNAIRFAESGSRVAVHIEADAPGHVRVVVDNAGPAIEPDHLTRLFDRFFRADDARCCEQDQQHHGLGLSIVAAIARMHAGRTVAESAGGRTRIGFTLAA
jgi:two-component system, OmpR family, heavy metal sensor histidine kinase CusS